MVPIVVELGVEGKQKKALRIRTNPSLCLPVTYPVPESISTSMLWQIAQVFGFILVLVMDRFRDPSGTPPNNMDRGLIFQAVTSGVCVVLSILYSGRMLRTEAYQQSPFPLEVTEVKDESAKNDLSKTWRPAHLRENSSTETISVVMVGGDPKE